MYLTCSAHINREAMDEEYYVMRHVHKIISANIRDSWKEIFSDPSPLMLEVLQEVQEQWTTVIKNTYFLCRLYPCQF
ncbi:hypothetical protein PHAVU_002G066200 [Phaseolus vulgaris]|uniref:Uncharacterized protein n=1 Tax=Phaseolus vulgaris TaxID=3885 RepID=V7CJ39_PHAVU|nr:hypothetical protein PHAVU_002G066200g [Phaseolus vulgaris]ESW29383.1 hypothetical protein PHAVU_002G066200g [Phaseolus vulgaris]